MSRSAAQVGLIAKGLGLEFEKEKRWFVTHVEESTGLFYLQLTDPSISVKYERLYQEIAGFASADRPKNAENLVKIGDVCLAKFSEDEQWYRAQVLSLETEDEEVEVYFIDYGNGEFTAWKSLKTIPEKFCELPAQAWQCRLANVEPVGGIWSKEAIDLLKELILDRELFGTPTHLCKSGAIVMRLCADDEKSVLVAQQLVMSGFAHWKKTRSKSSSSPSIASSDGSNSLSVKVKPGQLGQIKVKVGKYLDLCLSYCESPDLFYCQPIVQRDELTAMQDELQLYYSSNQATDLALKSATVDQLCCARFSCDENWYRGIIRSVSGDKFEVQFIDFGNSEILPLKEIKNLSAKFLQLPILGLKCALYGIMDPKGGKNFSTEVVTKFEEMTLDKELVAHVKEVDSDGKIKIILFDTTDTEELNINNELVKCRLASSIYPVESLNCQSGKSSSSQSASQSTPQPKYVSINFDVGATELSYVSFGSDPMGFYCQLGKNADGLENMMQELNDEYCKFKKTENKLQLAGKGVPCCAKYAEDERYYRAEILSINNGMAKIHYIDYGNDEECKLEDLKHLKKEYVKLPRQAFKCKLSGVRPQDHIQFSTDARNKFGEIVLDKEFVMTVVDKDTEGCVSVALVERNARNVVSVDVAKTLADAGFAVIEAKKGNKGPVVTRGNYKEVNVSTKEYIDIVVTFVTNPNQFCCQLVENADAIDAMMADLDETYQKAKPNPNMVLNRGLPVVAIYPDDGMWYRAVILNVSADSAEVAYIDFGNSEKIPFRDIRPIFREFMKLPAQAFVACLYDIQPKAWSKTEIEGFSGMVLDKHLIALVKSKNESNVHSIELNDTMTNRKQHLNISDLLVDRGLAHRPGSRPSQPPKTESSTSKKEQLLFKLNEKTAVEVVFVNDPSSFYLQVSSTIPRINELMDKLDADYSQLSANNKQISTISNGKLVAAKYSDDFWYRGRIESKQDNNKFCVQYIDYGNKEDTAIDRLKELSADLSKDPPYAVHCSLDNISPSSKSWTEATIQRFKELVEEKAFTAVFTTEAPPFNVSLSDNGPDVATILVNEELAVKAGTVVQTSEALEYSDMKLKVGDVEQVYVTNVDDLDNISCQLVRLEAELNTVMELVAEACATPNPLSSVKTSQAVLSQFSEDKSWYRGKVAKMIDNNNAHVCFVDYGNSETVHISKMQPATKHLVKQSKFAVVCTLDNGGKAWKSNALNEFNKIIGFDDPLKMTVRQVKGSRLVVELAKPDGSNIADSLCVAEQSVPGVSYPKPALTMGKEESFDISYVNTMSDVHVQRVSLRDALDEIMGEVESCKKEKYPSNAIKIGSACLAQFSEDLGWYRGAIDKLDASKVAIRFVDYGNAEEKGLADVYQLPPNLAVTAPFAIGCSLKGAEAATTADLEKFKEMSYDKEMKGKLTRKLDDKYELFLNDVPVCASASATSRKAETKVAAIRVTTGQELDCYVAHTESFNEFYVQPCKLSDDLDKVTNKMAEIGASPSAYPDVVAPSIGTHCCAKYSEDGGWYRCEILKKMDQKYQVRFIDYGNTDTVTAAELKEMPKDFVSISKLAIQCKLHGKAENSDANIDKFVNITIDQVISVTFVELEGDVFSVDLKMDRKNINGSFGGVESGTSGNNQATIASIPIENGLNWDCYIAHTESLNEFYVQPCKLSDDLDKVTNKMAEIGASPSAYPGVAAPTIGTNCCAKYSEDGGWYRCEILKKMDQKYQVRFIDYGNTDTVTAEEFKEMPKDVVSVPKLAIQCKLDGKAENSDANIDKFVNMTIDQVISVTLVEQEGDVFSVDLSMDGKNINELFGAANNGPLRVQTMNAGLQARSGVPSVVSPAVIVEYSEHLLTVGSTSNIVVSFVTSPQEFYCQLSKDLDALDELMGKIEAHYSALADNQECLTSTVVAGMPCAAKYTDECWYRAVIESVKNDNEAVVRFVDYGNSEAVKMAEIKTLKADLLEWPMFAVKCGMVGVTAGGENFENRLIEKPFDMKVCGVADGKCMVELFDGETNLSKEFGKQSNEQVVQDTADYRFVTLSPTDVEDVYFLHGESPAKFYCQLAKYEDKLAAITDDLVAAESEMKTVNSPKKNQPCVALFSEDSCWYRGRIMETKPGQARVFFVDYANEEWVENENIKVIPDKFKELPQQAIMCSLSGAHPSSGSWSTNDMEVLKEKCGEESLSATVVSVADGCVSVILKIKNTGEIINDAFPCVSGASSGAGASSGPGASKVIITPTETIDTATGIIDTASKVNANIQFKMPDFAIGKVYDATCTFITEDAKICCQLLEYQENLDVLMGEIDTYCASNNSVLTDAIVGMPCIAKYSVDEGWYRAEIMSVNESDNTATVEYVDYGNTEVTPVSNLKTCPADYLKLPVSCMRVSVPGCNSQSGSVSEVKVWLEENCLDQLIRVNPVSGDGRNFEGEIRVVESSIEVSEALNQKFGKKSTTNVASQIQVYGRPKLAAGSEEKILLSHVTSFNEVSCHLMKHQNEFNKMMEEIAEYCNKCQEELKDPVKGQVCLGRFPIDGAWYRCSVLSHNKEMVKLQYVDYGNEEEVVYADTRPMNNEFMKLACLGVSCPLHDVHKKDLDVTQAMQWLEETCFNQEYTMKVVAAEEHVEVNLYYPGSEDTINDELYANFALEDAEEAQPTVVDSKVSGDPSPVEESVADSTVGDKPLCFSAPDIDTSSSIAAFCSYVDDNLTVHCQLAKYATDLDTLMAHIADYCVEVETLPDPCDAGLACFAQFAEDLGWYRAEILAKQADAIDVSFVDYGNTATITKDQLRPIEQSFVALPRVCVPFQIEGVDHIEAPKELLKLWMEEKLLEQSVEINVVNNIADGFYRGSLSVEGVDFASMLSSQFKKPSVVNDGPVSVVDDAPASFVKGDSANAPHGEGTDISIRSVGNPVFKYTMPAIAAGDAMDVFCTYVESSNIVYCQLSKYQNDLDALTAKFTEYCENTVDNKASYSIGDACLARYSADQLWYRAEVKELKDDQVMVYMTDYGNLDTLPLSEIRPITSEFVKLPATCVKCQLHEVYVEDLDVAAALKWLQESFVEAEVKLEVVNTVVDGYDCILIKPNAEISINDELYALFALPEEGEVVSVSDVDQATKSDVNGRPAENGNDIASAAKVEQVSIPKEDAITANVEQETEPIEDVTSGNQLEGSCNAIVIENEPQAVNTGVTTAADGNVGGIENEEKPLLKYSSLPLASSDVIDVICTHIESSQEIYCQLSKYQTDLDTLTEIFTEYCEKYDDVKTSVAVGSACLARYSADQSWYRAEVRAVSDDKAVVFMSDYGNHDTVPVTDIRPIKPEFAALPVAAVKCKLHEVFVEDLDMEAGMKWLLDNVIEAELKLEVIGVLDDTYDCVLTKPDSGVSVNDELYSLFALEAATDNTTDGVGASKAIAKEPEASKLADEEEAADAAIVTVNPESAIGPNDNISKADRKLNDGGTNSSEPGTTTQTKESAEPITATQNKQPIPDVVPAPEALKYSRSALTVNSSESVICTHVESTRRLYFQLAKYQTELDTLAIKISDFCNDNDNPVLNLDVGIACLARFSEDHSWYRAEVTAIFEDGVEVFFVDYGNTDSIPITETRTLTKEFTSLPVASIPCQLHDVHDEDLDVKLAFDWLNENLLESEVMIQVVDVLEKSFDCVLKREGSDISVNDQLYELFALIEDEAVNDIANEAATIDTDAKNAPTTVELNAEIAPKTVELNTETTPATVELNTETTSANVEINFEIAPTTADLSSETAPKTVEHSQESADNSVKDTNVLEYTRPALSIDCCEGAMCTHIESLQRLYCQLSKYQTELDELTTKISEYCETASSLTNLNVGTACLARFSEDQCWYRAEVTAIFENEVNVFFVDYGNSDTIPIGETRALLKEFTSLPVASILCQLHDVHDEDLDVKSALDWLNENLLETEVKIQVVDVLEKEYSCVLTTGSADVSVNDKLYGMFALVEEELEHADTGVTEDAKREETSECVVSAGKTLCPTDAEIIANEADTPAAKQVILAKEITMDTTLKMHLSLVTSPSDFCLQFDDTSQDLIDLMAAINEASSCGELASFDAPPGVGTFCCAQYDEDEHWYRGEILERVTDDEFIVKFVDHGNIERLSIDKIKVLESRFHALHRQSLQCLLHGIKPCSDDGVWSAESIAVFENICSEDVLVVSFVKKDAENFHVVVTATGNDVAVNVVMVNNGLANQNDAEANGCC